MVVVLKRRNGTLSPSDNIQLNGIFSTAGAVDYAKGYLRQVSFVLNHIIIMSRATTPISVFQFSALALVQP